jgi:hypothetical protein
MVCLFPFLQLELANQLLAITKSAVTNNGSSISVVIAVFSIIHVKAAHTGGRHHTIHRSK